MLSPEGSMPRVTGLLHEAVLTSGFAGSMSAATQPATLPPYLWYESWVLWAGGDSARICPVGFDRHTAFRHRMLGNVLNPSFPQMAGPYAASFLVATFRFDDVKYCLVAGSRDMTGSTEVFCESNGIKVPPPPNFMSAGSAVRQGVPPSWGPVYPAPLLFSVRARTPYGRKTVSPKFILSTPVHSSLALLRTSMFLAPNERGEL
jgi:hypothetical protein